MIDEIFNFFELPYITNSFDMKQGVNDKYFELWESERRNPGKKIWMI